VLSEDEIKELKGLLPNARLTKATELAVWILLATCSRVGELSKAKWSDVDINAGTWVIPAGNAKNRKPHTVFLSDFAARQFNALRGVCESDVWVYPNRTNESHMDLKGIVKQLRDRQRAEPLAKRSAAVATLRLHGGDWVPHDLRRTGATMMASLGVMPEIIERCLNHIEQNKMTRIYQRYDFSAEQQRAWSLLGQRLELLTTQETKVRPRQLR
jgi:integrase